MVILGNALRPGIEQRRRQPRRGQERAAAIEPPAGLTALLGQAEGSVTVERVECHLRVNLVDPVAQRRPRPQQRVDRPDVAKDVVALNRGREGRVAGRREAALAAS